MQQKRISKGIHSLMMLLLLCNIRAYFKMFTKQIKALFKLNFQLNGISSGYLFDLGQSTFRWAIACK